MAVSTKQRILDACVRLFNESGVDAVRLQQIAEEIGISVGNLAYHFKTKDAIIESVYEQATNDFNAIFRHYLPAPELVAFDQQLSLYYRFFGRYQFYLAEFFKGNPGPTDQHTAWQQASNKMLLQLRSWLDFHVQRAALLSEPAPGRYDQLTGSLWLTLIFTPASRAMQGQLCDEAIYKRAIWDQLVPYLTPEGHQEFNKAVMPLIEG